MKYNYLVPEIARTDTFVTEQLIIHFILQENLQFGGNHPAVRAPHSCRGGTLPRNLHQAQ